MTVSIDRIINVELVTDVDVDRQEESSVRVPIDRTVLHPLNISFLFNSLPMATTAMTRIFINFKRSTLHIGKCFSIERLSYGPVL